MSCSAVARAATFQQAACLALCVVVAFGCVKDESTSVQVHPVRGTVKFNGQPAARAIVTLYPVNNPDVTVAPRGVAGDDGAFTLSSYGTDDGAPAGEYQVAIEWKVPSDPAISLDDSEAMAIVPDKLKGRYAIPEQSGLTATVTAGDNQLPPFELK